MRLHTILLTSTLGLAIAMPPGSTAAAPSSRVRQRARILKRAATFEQAAKADKSGVGKRALQLLDKLRQGEVVSSFNLRNMERTLSPRSGAKPSAQSTLDSAGFHAAFELALGASARVRARAVLEKYARDGKPVQEVLLDPLSARLLSLVDGYHFNRALGRDKLARKSAKMAKRIARRFGLDAEAALKAKTGFVKEARRDWEGQRPTKATMQVERRNASGTKAERAHRVRGTSRRVGGTHLWWTGYQPAYLDLLYRRLPGLLEKHLATAPDQPFRIWHAGHEDASQTFLLAGMVDEALTRLAKKQPKLRKRAAALRVEMVATDLVQGLKRSGREVRFNVDEGPQAIKFPILTSEIGAGEGRKARSSVARGEKMLERPGHDHVLALRRLADVGKVPLLFERMLRPGPTNHGYTRARDRAAPGYLLERGTWRVVDKENGGVVNASVKKRQIVFRFSDLTQERPEQKADLVVCTNVLPYFHIYDGVANKPYAEYDKEMIAAEAASRNLSDAVKKGGALLVDIKTISWAQRSHQRALQLNQHEGRTKGPTLLERLTKGKKQLWVTTTRGVEKVEDLAKDYEREERR